jgi:alanine racemase
MQFERFENICGKLEDIGIKIPIKHICNSAGILKYKSMHLDMVRAGIISYGLYPSKYVNRNILNLMPAMSIKTVTTRIQYIGKGEKISYGGTFTAPYDMKIATIPIGYADGYIRALQGKAKVIVSDRYAEIVGRICMDQCMIDVTNVNTISVEDEVIIIGEKGGKSISFDKLAEDIGTINYELLCLIGKRVPRVYLRDGNVTDVLSYLV